MKELARKTLEEAADENARRLEAAEMLGDTIGGPERKIGPE